MTVINDVKTALAGLKSAQASFETFALSTDNEQAKHLYQDAAKQTQSVLQSVEPRVQQIEQEEPQYAIQAKKMFGFHPRKPGENGTAAVVLKGKRRTINHRGRAIENLCLLWFRGAKQVL